MTRVAHIQPNATGGRPPASRPVVPAAAWGAVGQKTPAALNKVCYSVLKAPPLAGEGLGRGFFGGERVWKLTGQVQQMYVDGQGYVDVVDLNNKTLYASPYLVYNEQGYSKHYYAGAERVSSRIGGGMMQAPMDPLSTPVEHLSEQENWEAIATDLLIMLNRSITCTGFDVSNASMEDQLFSIGHSATINDPEENWYIYHSDHLGSSAFLTDASGTPTQHLQYMPFGESFIEQRATTSYYTPYTFSAKERDLETGYSYFGARYYSSDISVWLSVDPMADKYPSMSAYMYCAGNPVMLVDPDGRDWFINEITGDVYYNFRYSKEDAGKGPMKGEGWVHFGPNGYFTDEQPTGNLPGAEYSFVSKAGGTSSYQAEVGYNQELMLVGDKAMEFMLKQGFEKREFNVDLFTFESHTAIPEPHGTKWLDTKTETILAVHSWTYVKKRSDREFISESNLAKPFRNINLLTQSWNEQRWEYGHYNYTPKNHTNLIANILNLAKDLVSIFASKQKK